MLEFVGEHDITRCVLWEFCVYTISNDRLKFGYNSRAWSHTFSEILDTNVIELFNLLHDQLLFVDLYDDGCASGITTSESEFTERGLEFLGDVNCVGLFENDDSTMIRGYVVIPEVCLP